LAASIAQAPTARFSFLMSLQAANEAQTARINSGSGRYLSIASSVCWIADGETETGRNRAGLDRGLETSRSPPKSRATHSTIVAGLVPRENPKAAEEEHRPKDHAGHQRPGDRARQLQGHEEPSLLHQREIGFGRGECILLSRRLRIEPAERVRDGLPTVESDLDFELRRVGVGAPPEEVVALSEPCFIRLRAGLASGPYSASA
jgi:hypothetical protein